MTSGMGTTGVQVPPVTRTSSWQTLIEADVPDVDPEATLEGLFFRVEEEAPALAFPFNLDRPPEGSWMFKEAIFVHRQKMLKKSKGKKC